MNKRTGRWKDILFVLPSLLGVSIFVLVPFCDIIRRSFTDVTGSTFIGAANYQNLFVTPAFLIAVKNTGRFIIFCVPLLLSLSLLIALVLYRGYAKFYKSIALLPMAVPIASLVFVWKMLFHQQGLLNSYLSLPTDWLNSDSAFFTLAASFIWKNLGYYVVLWSAGLSGIPFSIYEAAAIDGAGRFREFLNITLPCLRPMTSAVIILALTGTFKSYREAYLLAGEYPNQSIYMVQHLFHNWFRDMSIEKMAAGAVVIVIIFAITVYPFHKKGGDHFDA